MGACIRFSHRNAWLLLFAALSSTVLAAPTAQGCFENSTPLNLQGSSASQDVPNCNEACTANDKLVFAVSGTDCYCGNELPRVTDESAVRNCDTVCPGNGQYFCGGSDGGTTYFTVWLTQLGTEAGNVPNFDGSASSSSSSSTSTTTSTRTASTGNSNGNPTTTNNAATTTGNNNGGGGGGGGATASSGASSQGSSSSQGSGMSNDSTVAIAVGVVIGVVALALMGFIFWWVARRRRRTGTFSRFTEDSPDGSESSAALKYEKSSSSMVNGNKHDSYTPDMTALPAVGAGGVAGGAGTPGMSTLGAGAAGAGALGMGALGARAPTDNNRTAMGPTIMNQTRGPEGPGTLGASAPGAGALGAGASEARGSLGNSRTAVSPAMMEQSHGTGAPSTFGGGAVGAGVLGAGALGAGALGARSPTDYDRTATGPAITVQNPTPGPSSPSTSVAGAANHPVGSREPSLRPATVSRDPSLRPPGASAEASRASSITDPFYTPLEEPQPPVPRLDVAALNIPRQPRPESSTYGEEEDELSPLEDIGRPTERRGWLDFAENRDDEEPRNSTAFGWLNFAENRDQRDQHDSAEFGSDEQRSEESDTMPGPMPGYFGQWARDTFGYNDERER